MDGVNKYIISDFKSARLSRQEEEFNSMMSSVRESVEWSFDRLKVLWAYIDFKRRARLG